MSKVGNRNFPAIVQGDCSRRGDSNAARRALVPRWLCLLIGHRGPHTQYWPLSLAQPSPALSLLPACSWAATCMLPPLLVRCALSASWDDDDNNREHLWIFCPTPVSRSIRQMQSKCIEAMEISIELTASQLGNLSPAGTASPLSISSLSGDRRRSTESQNRGANASSRY